MKEPSASSLIRADAKLNFTELPSVFYLYTEETKGEPKHKYLVILSADRQEAYFFMIDSVRYWEGIGEIPVTTGRVALPVTKFMDRLPRVIFRFTGRVGAPHGDEHRHI